MTSSISQVACRFFALLFVVAGVAAGAANSFVNIKSATTPAGYLARLLINENPFPGERGYISIEDSKAGMLQVLCVLHGRMHLVPAGYRAEQIAGVRTTNILDVITAPRQCEGFSRDAAGRLVAAARVEQRLNHLLLIANSGGKSGKFAELLNYGQNLASAYFRGGIREADRFAGLSVIRRVPVTGRAYSWMTDKDCYHPGGSFVSIPDDAGGAPGGNRFFTLRRDPR